ncbi:TonB-dependent receptor [Roseiterribacter gracilis]|uniref:TonB-dependent receptor n=1 Tax=Roseiterribacter gracilis TaxID=2812848 RepID=A0A8S8XGU3_9PROT|nr:TonB-dependent receptor [Rhodospirillales bacterium TMPK1]
MNLIQNSLKLALLGSVCAATLIAAPVQAQQAPEEIVVTGIRRSLQDAADSKRRATNFTDSVYAEDIGKFPDLNLAEALNRIPGVQLTRDTSGEGVQISVRGLGPSFTKILLNGSQVAVASDGTTDSGNSNREVDLDMFPTELFTKLEVSKTPTAHQLEGGVAGTVDMRNARAFDNPGMHANVVAQGQYNDSSGKYSPRGAMIVSNTWGEKFGALLGVAGANVHYRTDGFETIGYTTPTISCAGCNTSQGVGFSFATTVPANAGQGLTPGAPVNLVQTSGLSLQQLSNSLWPRLARNAILDGTRDRASAVLALEFRPTDRLQFTLDILGAKANRNFNRLDMNLAQRNSNFTVPIGVQVDANNVVTHATLANAQFFLEARPYSEDVDFFNVNPGGTWWVNDWLKIQGQVNYGLSHFHRVANSYLFNTPLNSGLAVTLDNPAGADFPIVTPNQSLDNPNLGWQWNSIRVQSVRRSTTTRGTHWDGTVGDENGDNIKVGVAYDDALRTIKAYDNGTAANTFGQSAVPNSSLSQFLISGPADGLLGLSGQNPGYTRFVQPNYGKLDAATNLKFFSDSAPFVLSSATNTPSGAIREKNLGGYAEINGVAKFFDRDIRMNAGVRAIRTQQSITGPISINGVISSQTLDTSYNAYLPSFNAAVDLWKNVVLRLAGSRTMTRPNPNQMLPGTTFSDPSAQVANQGNPNLAPYYSDNADIGLEYYTGGSGYLAVNFFHKAINGFTVNQQVTRPFSDLGIPLSSLAQIQQDALLGRQGVNTLISVNTQVNIGQTLYLNGLELTVNQPLDFITKGLGFTGNYTHIDQSSTGTAAVATGLAKYAYNIGAYYENYGVSLRVTYNYLNGRVTATAPQNNVNVPLRTDPYGQIDMSVNYTLPWMENIQLTFNGINLNNERIRNTFGYDNAAYSVYYPGRQFIFGVRGKF